MFGLQLLVPLMEQNYLPVLVVVHLLLAVPVQFMLQRTEAQLGRQQAHQVIIGQASLHRLTESNWLQLLELPAKQVESTPQQMED